jgi:hypothetical protein
MTRKHRADFPAESTKAARAKRSVIPEQFQTISSATAADGGDVQVPMLLLYGDWLKAVGFPIGSAAVLTTDRRGELALHRLGLGFPRRLYIRAASSD